MWGLGFSVSVFQGFEVWVEGFGVEFFCLAGFRILGFRGCGFGVLG